MIDYKESLNLPRTAFPMRARLSQREPEILQQWRDQELYSQLRQSRAGRRRFVLHDGPPYANGDVHVGHVVNKVLKDMIVKYKTLEGFDAPYIPGWDCHGLPIELEVERSLGHLKEPLSELEFCRRCRDYAHKQIARQKKDFVRLGVIGDWAAPYLTMAATTEAGIIGCLGELIEAGYLQKRYKPVFWCRDCNSALAEAEVEYADHTSRSADVGFAVADMKDFCSRMQLDSQRLDRVLLVIWTTTIWTLPANQAVAVHPELRYVLVNCTVAGRRLTLLLAGDLLEQSLRRLGAEQVTELAAVEGRKLAQLSLCHPFLERRIPVVCSDHVTTDSGTGAVHIAPAHGLDDYRIGLHYDLNCEHHLRGDGTFDETAPVCAGQSIEQASATLEQRLADNGSLLSVADWQHSYPHCWRHRTPVLFRATSQWFVSMDHRDLLARARQELTEAVTFVPESGRNRMMAMLDNRPDWCISRQRSWGVPFPLFEKQTDGTVHPRSLELLHRVQQAVAERGVEAWFELDIATMLGADAPRYHKSSDILDVWFDSGTTHRTVLAQRAELSVPADMYLEGSDQHRGWFQSSLLTSIALDNRSPYRRVVTHGFVVDQHGRKMSKSRGNVIKPQQVISRLGADVLRLWVAATDFRSEMRISDEILNGISDSYRKIRNTIRYLIGGMGTFKPAQQIEQSQFLALDYWILRRAALLQEEIREDYEECRFHQLCQKLHHFCAVELGTRYLDIIKDRQYTTPRDGLPFCSGQSSQYLLLDAIVRWIAPILSFTAEEVWQYLPTAEQPSVLLAEWSQQLQPFRVEDKNFSDADWQQLWQLRSLVNRQIESNEAAAAGSRLAVEVRINCRQPLLELLRSLGDELRFFLITAQVTLAEDRDQQSDQPQVEVCISEHPGCSRCWQHCPDVGEVAAHPQLCRRCVDNISGHCETRRYV